MEFKELINNILQSERKSFHLYAIQRILNLGLIIGYTYEYKPCKREDCMKILLDLKKSGTCVFIVNLNSNYTELSSREDKDILRHFLDSFNTDLSEIIGKEKIF